MICSRIDHEGSCNPKLVGVDTSIWTAARKKGTLHGWLIAIGRYDAIRKPPCIFFV
jgi:hypothetical protein